MTDTGTAENAGWSISEIRPRPMGTGIPSREHIQRMLRIVGRLLFIESIEDLMNEIAKGVRDLFSVNQVIVWMVGEDGKHRPAVAQGFPPDVEREMLSLSHGEDYDAQVKKVANRVSAITYFVPAEALIPLGHDAKNLECIAGLGMASGPRKDVDSWQPQDYLKVSILSLEGRFIGSITVCSTADGRIPTLETVKAMEIYSSICSVAIEFANVREKEIAIAHAAEGRSAQISQVLSFARDVLSLESPEKVLSSALNILKDLFGFQAGAISLLDEKENAFRYVAMMGYNQDEMEYAKTLRVPAEMHRFYVNPEWLVGRNAYYIPVEQLPDERLLWEIYSPDTYGELKKSKSEPRAHPGAWHQQDNLLFAIQNKQGRVIGLLCPDKPVDGRIPPIETIEGIALFTSLASIALENAKYYSEIIRVKEEIELLNGLLFHDVSKLNTSIRESLEEAAGMGMPRDQRMRSAKSALQMLDSVVDLIQKVRRLSSIRSMSAADLLRVDLAAALRSQMKRIMSQYPNRNIKESYGNIPANCYVLANDLIGELFGNILTNAVIHNYGENPEIAVSIDGLTDEFNNKIYWDVSIGDNGPGIPDERKGIIFDITARIGESEGRTGVGLSVVKSIASLYGGSVWVEDRSPNGQRRGSVFHILLPAA